MPSESVARALGGGREGKRIGSYLLEVAVAEGSMGRIYRAGHVDTGARVALKVLHEATARDPVAVERFRREYETAVSLRHPHIVRVSEFGETEEGDYFLAMEYLEGDHLGTVLCREGAFEPARMARVLCQLAMGLHHAHSQRVIHRDLKPANILVCKDQDRDDVRIVDFGSVKLQQSTGPKLTALGTTLGSPYYMSPEQAMGRQDLDPRSDVFALAAIVHELCTGQVAFGGDSAGEILAKITGDEPAPVSALNPAYPWALDDVVKRGLRKDRADRFSSTVELAEAVLRALQLPAEVEEVARAQPGQLTVPQTDERAIPETSTDVVSNAQSIPSLPIRSGAKKATWIFAAAFALGAGVVVWLLGS